MNRSDFIDLLTRLLVTHSPSGDEREIDAVIEQEFTACGLAPEQDAAGNIIARISGAGHASPVCVMAHKDEIGVIIKRIEDDGRLVVDRIGGSYPWRYGEGPMDVLADSGVVTGFLGVGASHTSAESKTVHEAKSAKALSWDMVRLDLKLSRDELCDLGVRPGARAVVSRHRKRPVIIGDYIGGWALDDKALVAVMLQVVRNLAAAEQPPSRDVWFVASAGEETGVAGGAYAAKHLEVDEVLALEVAPVAKEYRVVNSDQPVLIYMDARAPYHKEVTDRLYALGMELGFECQSAVVSSFGSDASYSHSYGHVARPVCIGIPTENTHGYEVSNLGAMHHLAELVTAYLMRDPTRG